MEPFENVFCIKSSLRVFFSLHTFYNSDSNRHNGSLSLLVMLTRMATSTMFSVWPESRGRPWHLSRSAVFPQSGPRPYNREMYFILQWSHSVFGPTTSTKNAFIYKLTRHVARRGGGLGAAAPSEMVDLKNL